MEKRTLRDVFVYLNNGHSWLRNISYEDLLKTNTDAVFVEEGSVYRPSTSIWLGNYQGGNTDLADVDGDGLVDLIRNITGMGRQADVWLNKSPKYNLLTQIQNSIGGSVSIAYNSSTYYNNNGGDNISDLPFSVQVVSSIIIHDGIGNQVITNYTYSGGMYNPPEREFRGFAYAKVTDPEGNTTESHFKQDDVYRGCLYRQETKDAAGNLYSKTENTWQYTQSYTGVYFPYLAHTDNYTYDGDTTSKQTRIKFEYDSYGNPTKVISEGDVSITGD
jgi:hypothetical protein